MLQCRFLLGSEASLCPHTLRKASRVEVVTCLALSGTRFQLSLFRVLWFVSWHIQRSSPISRSFCVFLICPSAQLQVCTRHQMPSKCTAQERSKRLTKGYARWA